MDLFEDLVPQPTFFDFLCLTIEGAELEALRALDIEKIGLRCHRLSNHIDRASTPGKNLAMRTSLQNHESCEEAHICIVACTTTVDISTA